MIFVIFKFSTLKIQIRDDLNPIWEIQLFISVSDFHSFKPNLIEHVLLV